MTMIDNRHKKEVRKTISNMIYRNTPVVTGWMIPGIVLVFAISTCNSLAILIIVAWICISMTVVAVVHNAANDMVGVIEDAADEIEMEKNMTQEKIMYECGCVAGGDNCASFCPMHGYPIVRMCAYIDTCKLSAIFGGFPTCYDSWEVMEDDRESRCSVYTPAPNSKSPTPQ